MLLISAVMAGIFAPGMNVFLSDTLFQVSTEENRPTFLATNSFLANVTAFVAPMLGTLSGGSTRASALRWSSVTVRVARGAGLLEAGRRPGGAGAGARGLKQRRGIAKRASTTAVPGPLYVDERWIYASQASTRSCHLWPVNPSFSASTRPEPSGRRSLG